MTRQSFTLRRSLLVSATLSLLTLLVLPISPAFAQDREAVHLQTPLAGPEIQDRQPQGIAVYNANNGRASLFVEIRHVPVEEGPLNVTVVHEGNSTIVGQITLNPEGAGQLLLTSRAGDQVPAIEKGDMVILSGTDEARSSQSASSAGDDPRIATGVF